MSAHLKSETDLKPTVMHMEDTDYLNDRKEVDSQEILSKEYAPVGRENLHERLPPHPAYEGYDRWDETFTWEPAEERAVVRKADMMLMTVVCIMFLGLQLDRGNLSNALADNLLKDIGITTNDYNTGTTVQLLAFLLCEFPSQMILSRVGFQKWLPFLMLCWGLVSTFQGFMHSKAGFYITRVLIGACESGFIPGAVQYTSYWYTSKELSIRLSFFWSTLNVARVISSLAAAGILQMRGIEGHTGWFWLFIIEGTFTCLVAILAFLWLPASPFNAHGKIYTKVWFTERQEKIMCNRILRDDPAKGLSAVRNKIQWKDIREAWSDKHLWCLTFCGLIAYIPASPVQAYITYNLKQLGFNTIDSNLLSAPSAFLQIITMLAISYSSNYFQERTFHCIFGELWSMPCLIAMLCMHGGGKYWGRWTTATLIAGYPYFHPILTSWISENSFNVKRRSIQITTYNVVVQIGSVISSQIYRTKDAPYYYTGNKVLVSICAVSAVAFLLARMYIDYENGQKEKIWSSMTNSEKQAYQEDLAAREADGPKRLDFRLTR